ncbi:MAG: ATP-binding protein [Polyangiales bacterium]
MTIARNLVFWLLAAICVVLALQGALRVRSAVEVFDADMRRDHELLGRGLGAAVIAMWTSHGAEAARDLVHHADPPSTDIEVRWVSLEAGAPGDPTTIDPTMLESLLHGSIVHAAAHNAAGEERLATWVPLPALDGKRTALYVSEDSHSRDRYVRTSVRTSIYGTLAIIVVCGVLATAIGSIFVGQPVARLVEQARRIGRGELTAHVAPTRRDELGTLADEMNAMADRLAEANRRVHEETQARIEAMEQLRQADRLLTVGRLASGIAHELGTPLQVVTGRASLIAGGEVTGDEAKQFAGVIVSEVDRMAGIIRQLLDFARHRHPDKIKQDIPAIARQVSILLGPLAERKGVQFEIDERGATPISVDGAQIQQVITNLLVNAVQAMPKGGHVPVACATGPKTPPDGSEANPGEFLTMTVEDEGTGIDPNVLPRVFEPFFTTKDVGEGTGLGLSVSYGIVREHAGYIEVDSEVGRGTTFHVHLPLGV